VSTPIEYEISLTFLDAGECLVQVQGKPWPLGLYKESGPDLGDLVLGAQRAIEGHRNGLLAAG
jgi:hypothetical protein